MQQAKTERQETAYWAPMAQWVGKFGSSGSVGKFGSWGSVGISGSVRKFGSCGSVGSFCPAGGSVRQKIWLLRLSWHTGSVGKFGSCSSVGLVGPAGSSAGRKIWLDWQIWLLWLSRQIWPRQRLRWQIWLLRLSRQIWLCRPAKITFTKIEMAYIGNKPSLAWLNSRVLTVSTTVMTWKGSCRICKMMLCSLQKNRIHLILVSSMGTKSRKKSVRNQICHIL